MRFNGEMFVVIGEGGAREGKSRHVRARRQISGFIFWSKRDELKSNDR